MCQSKRSCILEGFSQESSPVCNKGMPITGFCSSSSLIRLFPYKNLRRASCLAFRNFASTSWVDRSLGSKCPVRGLYLRACNAATVKKSNSAQGRFEFQLGNNSRTLRSPCQLGGIMNRSVGLKNSTSIFLARTYGFPDVSRHVSSHL